MRKDGRSTAWTMTRREFLASSAIGTIPLFVSSARAGQAPGQPSSSIRRGGTLVASTPWTYPTMDPHISTMGADMLGCGAMFNLMVRLQLVDARTWEQKLVGDLAESWEQPDLSTIVFKLRSGVTFHDGSPFTAEVAAWNFLRCRDHPKSFLKSQMANLASAEAVNRTTLRLKLKSPNAGFLYGLAKLQSGVAFISKTAIDKLGDEGFARSPVGTGPFRFKQWITDDRLITERNPSYFEKGADGKPLPYLDGFVHRYVPDPSVALVDMRAGTVHLLERVPAKDAATAKADQSLATYELPWVGDVYFYGGFNVKKPPFNDVRVRQAALYGVDREGMAKAIGFGFGTPYYYGEWAKGTLGYDESIVKQEYNPAKVTELLKAAGYPDGISIELKVISREPENTIGEFVQQMWTAVGIKTKLVAMERLSWIDSVRAMNFDTCFWRGSFSFTTGDPDTETARIACGAPSNWAQWCDPDVDKMMKQGAAVTDRKKRHESYREALRLMQERAYLYSGIAVPWVNVARKEVQGLTHSFSQPVVKSAWLAA
jgi:peptide/nickel transport system substrate-binding protein